MRFASPATALASCSSSGRRVATPISAPGNDAKPPKPMTTSGRRRRNTFAASTHAAASANGPSSIVARPLPRTPRKLTLSKSTPCCGTSFDSIPSRVPSQNTRAPDAASLRATASPGNTWPPLPPVVIITVAVIVRRSYGESPQQPAILVVDPQQHRDGDAVGDDAAAAERQQRQCQPLGRQQSDIDADVDERLHADPHADPLRAQRGERPREARRLAADRPRAIQQPHEQRDHA